MREPQARQHLKPAADAADARGRRFSEVVEHVA
jgi:hypothetical protein